jgi:hypothetical protein
MIVNVPAHDGWRARMLRGLPIRQIIGGIDDHLSHAHGVRTFSEDEQCILRFAPIRSRRDLCLSDGSKIVRGDLLIDLHCWNERVPLMPSSGPDLAWAQETSNRLRHTLRLLAAALVADSELQEARACRARVNFVGRGCSNESVSRIIRRLGFEDVDEGSGSIWARAHDHLENVLIAALVWTHNPEALRRDKMIRERRPVWASRSRLLQRHGSPSHSLLT